MRALTSIEPMGWAVVHGHKPYENRPRDMRPKEMRGVRTRVAIHAGAKWDDGYAMMVHELAPGVRPTHVPMAVIGVATFTGRVFTLLDPPPRDATGRAWFFGPFGFEIDTADSFALPRPVPWKGMLGFWTLPADVEARVMEQLS